MSAERPSKHDLHERMAGQRTVEGIELCARGGADRRRHRQVIAVLRSPHLERRRVEVGGMLLHDLDDCLREAVDPAPHDLDRKVGRELESRRRRVGHAASLRARRSACQCAASACFACRNHSIICRYSGPGRPDPTGRLSIEVMAITSRPDELSQTSSAARSSASGTGRSSTATPWERAMSMAASYVMPGRICTLLRGAIRVPPATIIVLVLEPSVRNPSRSITVSLAPWSIAYCFIRTLPSSDVLLMSQCSQRSSACVTTGTPFSICSAGISGQGDVFMNTVGLTPAGNG